MLRHRDVHGSPFPATFTAPADLPFHADDGQFDHPARRPGMAMYFGTLLIVVWLGAAALGDGPLGVVNAIFGFWLVQVVFFFATWALFHHMLGGIRHFVWDSAYTPSTRSAARRSRGCSGWSRSSSRLRPGRSSCGSNDRHGPSFPTRRRTTVPARQGRAVLSCSVSPVRSTSCSRCFSSGSWCGWRGPIARQWSMWSATRSSPSSSHC